MVIRKLIAAAALVLASVTAFATPQFSGETRSSDITSFSNAGYYLWQDDAAPSSWHLRWTGVGAEVNPVSWTGSIIFTNDELGVVLGYSFENTEDTVTAITSLIPGSDLVVFTSITDNSGGVDGLDFTLTGGTELLEFNLGSSIFTDRGVNLADPGISSEGIFIGAGLSGTQVLTSISDGMVYQQFEVAVLEPNSIALLGLGIFCLALARRRQATSA